MIRLFITSLIWAFSFSLIGNFIVGKVDIYFAIFVRFALALLIFLPFIKRKNIFSKNGALVASIGALQIGVMYIFYFNSFRYLSVIEVALFTIVTPLYISLIGSIFEAKFKATQLINIAFVIVGAAVIKWGSVSDNFVLGFLLVQGANLSFGLGQALYKRFVEEHDYKESFALFNLGALIPIIFLLVTQSKINLEGITTIQWAVMVWLGLVASGLGYYLWNTGSKLVTYGQLAVMNNLVIPLAIIVNIIFWDKNVNWSSFLIGSFILILGVFLEKRQKTNF